MPANLPGKFKPQKKLGQNFLTDKLQLAKIVNSFEINEETRIIEVGPGYGSLTEFLVDSSSDSVTCIEKDPRLHKWLNSNFVQNHPKLNIILNDALNIDWSKFVSELNDNSNNKELIVVGNLPYNISNKLLTNLIVNRSLFKKFGFLVQKEVARRWVASDKIYKKEYSSLSVFVNYFCETSLVFEVPKRLFNPIPKVDGALVLLEIKQDRLQSDEEKFFSFVKNCFRFRRKTLFNNVKSFLGDENKIKEIFEKHLYSLKLRPQDISYEGYSELFKSFY